MEYGLYAKISSNELIALAKDNNPDRADVWNLQKYSSFNRKLTKVAKYIVLTTDPTAQRRNILGHLIRVIEVSGSLHACVRG